jgi:hypothetical protein
VAHRGSLLANSWGWGSNCGVAPLAPPFFPELLGCAYLVDEAGEEAGGAAALVLRGGWAQAVMEAPRHAQQHAHAGRLRHGGTAPGKHTRTKSGLETRPVVRSRGGGRGHHCTQHNTAAAGAPEAKNERGCLETRCGAVFLQLG